MKEPKMKNKVNKMIESLSWRIVLSTIAGAGLGFAYYRLVGCRSGACPISGNPFISTIYGAVLGLVWGMK
jgi:hypothetical protein